MEMESAEGVERASVMSEAGGDHVEVDRAAYDLAREELVHKAKDMQVWLEESTPSEASDEVGADEVAATVAMAAAVARLRDVATRVQRIKRSQMVSKMRRGRGVNAAGYREPPRRMKQYSVKGTTVLTDLETAGGLYERIAAGERVATQLVARTAIGKTTRFPAMVAKKCGVRVLLLEPDVRLARYAAEAQRARTKVRVPWAEKRTEMLATMSYADFNAHFRGDNGVRMLSKFDVLIMDEAHVVDDEISAAKGFAATFAPVTLSLLVCSATLEGSDAQALSVPIVPTFTGVSLKTFVANGYLFRGPYARDRTLVIATDDQEAAEIAGVIEDFGCERKVLDSASRYSDMVRVREFMEESASIVDRFLVVTPGYGYGYNFPVDQVVTSAEKVVTVIRDGGRVAEEVRVHCSKDEVKQHCGRVNRGMGEKSVAIVCGQEEDLVAEETLTLSQRLREYLLLVAGNVDPSSAMKSDVGSLIPFGLTREVASVILSINLPCEIALRFFAADGRVPMRYLRALEAYGEADCQLYSSIHADPVGYDLWVSERMSGYYGEPVSEVAPALRVPCAATGDLRVVLHSIVAVAMGFMEVENWECPVSDVEYEEPSSPIMAKTKGVPYVPRMIEAVPARPRLAPVMREEYVYAVPQEHQMASRRFGYQMAPSVAASLADFSQRDLDWSSNDFKVRCEIDAIIDDQVRRIGLKYCSGEDSQSVTEGESGAIPAADVTVSSPGGSTIVVFRETVWKQMVAGKKLTGSAAKSFFHAVKNNVEGFVGSDAFSGWTDVWMSMFATFSDESNLQLIKNSGLVERATTLLIALLRRYTSAVREVSLRSFVRSSLMKQMLSSRTSFREVWAKQAKKGAVEIVQSEAFVQRLFALRDGFVVVVEAMENANMFSPTLVITLQEMLPLMRATGNRVIDKPSGSRSWIGRIVKTG